ncbi:MAG: hypothetical protein CM15mP77_2440 [Synechococcus sp.]|nr:MAG: hypothetical protein CM15mP77_2440 [Synechococcus sp.]
MIRLAIGTRPASCREQGIYAEKEIERVSPLGRVFTACGKKLIVLSKENCVTKNSAGMVINVLSR